MAITTYPLNNIEYSAADAELFHCTRSSGVWAGDEDFDATASGADNNVSIAPGLAWIRNAKFSGKVVAQKTTEVLRFALPDPTYKRIDAIILEYNANQNTTALKIKKGTAASSPQPPARVQTESLYELHLYHVLRKPGAVSIAQGDITDLRTDEKWCGVMYDDVTPKGMLNLVTKDDVGKPGGVASLSEGGKVPSSQLPSLDYIPNSEKDKFMLKTERGAYNGVASLSGGKVPSSQIPSLNYIPTSEKGEANGVATLDVSGKVPREQITHPRTRYNQNFFEISDPITNGRNASYYSAQWGHTFTILIKLSVESGADYAEWDMSPYVFLYPAGGFGAICGTAISTFSYVPGSAIMEPNHGSYGSMAGKIRVCFSRALEHTEQVLVNFTYLIDGKYPYLYD